MKNKEEILAAHLGWAIPNEQGVYTLEKNLYQAMQEYADQFAIDFKKWAEDNETTLMPISNTGLLKLYKQSSTESK
jgi:hypothetical protein